MAKPHTFKAVLCVFKNYGNSVNVFSGIKKIAELELSPEGKWEVFYRNPLRPISLEETKEIVEYLKDLAEGGVIYV